MSTLTIHRVRTMILQYQSLDLFGKMLFEKASIEAPFQKANPMHEEACFLYIQRGSYHSISEEEMLEVMEGESILMKCGNYLGKMLSHHEDRKYAAVAIHFYPEVMKKVYEDAPPLFLQKHNFQFHQNMVKLQAIKLIDS